jgi:hypothetical protein
MLGTVISKFAAQVQLSYNNFRHKFLFALTKPTTPPGRFVHSIRSIKMPPIRSARNRKPPPDGFDDIEDTLLEFANKMKDAENAPHEGKKRYETLWPVFQITHQRRCPYTVQEPCAKVFSNRIRLTNCVHRLKIYLRPLLRERSHLETTVRLAAEKWLRRCSADCKVEETRLREGIYTPHFHVLCLTSANLSFCSSAASVASKPRRQTSTPHASAGFPRIS